MIGSNRPADRFARALGRHGLHALPTRGNRNSAQASPPIAAPSPALRLGRAPPSQATKTRLDSTLHLTVNQAQLWGYGGIDQCNLIPFFESDSSKLLADMFVEDADNHSAIAEVLRNGTVWLSWGSAPPSCSGPSRASWNQIVESTLAMVHLRQAAGLRALLTRLVAGKGYRPPAYPYPGSRDCGPGHGTTPPPIRRAGCGSRRFGCSAGGFSTRRPSE